MDIKVHFKNCYDDLEVYMEYGYVFLSTTGRNHAEMAHCHNESFEKRIHQL